MPAASPATVKKHLERVYARLGVEIRTAAAGMAMNRIRQLHPQFECRGKGRVDVILAARL